MCIIEIEDIILGEMPMRELSSIRIFPLSMFDFETEYIAKLEIANGLVILFQIYILIHIR